jgi:hypothetical protein
MLEIELNYKKQKNINRTKSMIASRFNFLNLSRETVDMGCSKQLLFRVNSENIVVKILRLR